MEMEEEKQKLAESWKKIKEYVLSTKPELWDGSLDTAFQTLVLD